MPLIQLHLFSCVYLAVLLLPASPSPSLLSAAVPFRYRCCSCRSPLLVAYQPSPFVRCAVPFATFSFSHSPVLFYEGIVCYFFGFLFDWGSFCSLRISPSLVHLQLAIPLSLLGYFSVSTSPYLSVFLLSSVTSHFRAFAPLSWLLAFCGYFFSFRSSSSSLCIFLLGCPELHARVPRQFSLSSPSPLAIRLFPLGRSPLGSLSSLDLSFYPFGVFCRLRLLPLDFALALLSSSCSLLLGLSACIVSSFVRVLTPDFLSACSFSLSLSPCES